MNRIEISAIINKRFKKIETLSRDVINSFEIESIHKFRTEIKKLRAFLRLLNVEINDDNGFKISKKMKTFYGYAGTIRNLQLQMKNMDAYVEDSRYTIAEIYIDYLQKIIEKWKTNAIDFRALQDSFSKDKKKILEQLPPKLRNASGKIFIQNKMNELASLQKDLPDEDVQHSIRKLFKDILYNRPFIKQYGKLLPPVFSKEEDLKSFTELLGHFLDRGVGIILLETYCKDSEENGIFFENEMKEFHEIEGKWKTEREELGQIIYSRSALAKLLAAN